MANLRVNLSNIASNELDEIKHDYRVNSKPAAIEALLVHLAEERAKIREGD